MSGYLPHHKSQEALKCEMDLHSIPATQICIQESRDIEYKPLASLADQNTVEFFVAGTEEYIDPTNIFLHITAKITKLDGTAVGPGSKIIPINNLLHSLFSEVSVRLGDKILTSSDQEYAYKSYFISLLSQKHVGKSYLTSEMFFKDKNLTERDPTKLSPSDGASERYQRSKDGGSIDMIGRLHCDIFLQEKCLPNHLDLYLKLVRHKPEFCLTIADGDNTK